MNSLVRFGSLHHSVRLATRAVSLERARARVAREAEGRIRIHLFVPKQAEPSGRQNAGQPKAGSSGVRSAGAPRCTGGSRRYTGVPTEKNG